MSFLKFAYDSHGIVIDPDTQSRDYSAAALAASGGTQPEPRFTLATKATTQNREVH